MSLWDEGTYDEAWNTEYIIYVKNAYSKILNKKQLLKIFRNRGKYMQKENNSKNSSRSIVIVLGTSLGIGGGVAFGAMMDNVLPGLLIGAAVGTIIGIAVGSIIKSK